MTEMSPIELTRAINRLEGELGRKVPNVVYERDLNELRADIREIKESLKWATRFIAGLFVTLVVQLAFIVINNIPPP